MVTLHRFMLRMELFCDVSLKGLAVPALTPVSAKPLK